MYKGDGYQINHKATVNNTEEKQVDLECGTLNCIINDVEFFEMRKYK